MDTITAPHTQGYSVAPGEGERIWIVGDTMTVKAGAGSTGGALTLVENLTAPGGGPPPHLHRNEDEFFYVLEGSFEIQIGDELHSLGPGGFAFVPRGTVHRFRNTDEVPRRILVGFAPAGMDGFFREAGQPATDDGPAPPLDEAELARTQVAAERYGLELAA